ncbi:MAG: transcription initiation factor IIB family protein [Candidatus Bathyarchaeia archaeon]
MKNHNSDGFLATKSPREKTTQKKEVQQRTAEKCPECSSTNLIHDYDTGETICGGCGLVLREQMMDKGPEWRAFTQEEKASRSRVGVPTSYSVHDKGLSTAIGRVDRDAFGRKLPLSTRLQMWRLRKWQIRSRVHSSVDRNLAQAMAELDRLSDKAYIPGPVKEKAAVVYRKALDKGLVRGRSIAAIAAASLYAACRTTGTPRTLREIAEASFVDKKDVARCYRLLLRELKVQMPIADPLTYVSKIAERTGISGQTQGLAIKILHEAKRRRAAAGKDPMGLAAAALYIACLQRNEKKTQKDIAEAAGVTEVTVRNRYKSLKRELGIEIPD